MPALTRLMLALYNAQMSSAQWTLCQGTLAQEPRSEHLPTLEGHEYNLGYLNPVDWHVQKDLCRTPGPSEKDNKGVPNTLTAEDLCVCFSTSHDEKPGYYSCMLGPKPETQTDTKTVTDEFLGRAYEICSQMDACRGFTYKKPTGANDTDHRRVYFKTWKVEANKPVWTHAPIYNGDTSANPDGRGCPDAAPKGQEGWISVVKDVHSRVLRGTGA